METIFCAVSSEWGEEHAGYGVTRTLAVRDLVDRHSWEHLGNDQHSSSTTITVEEVRVESLDDVEEVG